MRRFYLKTTAFILLALLTIVVCGIRIGANDPSDYLASIIDKHARLKSISTPRIILAGGSNLAFGIDSKMMESQLRMPVCNMSLHAGLGLEFILSELKSEMRKGDIVFISLEYFMLKDGDYQLKKKATEYYPEAGKFFEDSYLGDLNYYMERKRTAMHDNFFLLKNKLLHPASVDSFTVRNSSVYRRDCFNEYGDVVCQLDQPSSIRAEDIDKFRYSAYEGIALLNSIYHEAQLDGVKMYFVYPNFPESVFHNNEVVIHHYSNTLSSKLSIPVLNDPEYFVMNDSLFFDTVYHLNGRGREIRTRKFIQLIEQKGILN